MDSGYQNALGVPYIDDGYGVSGEHEPRIRPEPVTQYSRSMEYGVAMLECFSSRRPLLRISELADILEVSRATTHRYGKTLVELGYLEQDKDRRYRLARNAGGPGIEFIKTLRLETPEVRMIFEDLRDVTGHTGSMGVLEGIRVLYTQRLFAHGTGQYEADLGLDVGAYVPAYCTAIGRALMASLSAPDQREVIAELKFKRNGPSAITKRLVLAEQLLAIDAAGLSVFDEEQGRGVRSIAAAITYEGRSRPMAISVTVPAKSMSVAAMKNKLGPHVRAAAERI
jgi:IclR family transcriptional regulator, pca regulon regulatory protein